jgi:hypothetical protein
MTAVAFLALALAVTVQSVRLQQALVRLQQALVREQRLRAEAALQRAQADLDQLLAGVAEQQRQASSAAPEP